MVSGMVSGLRDPNWNISSRIWTEWLQHPDMWRLPVLFFNRKCILFKQVNTDFSAVVHSSSVRHMHRTEASCSSLLSCSFISDGIKSTTAQFFAVISNGSLAEMTVITASMQSTLSTPPESACRLEAAGGERIEIKFIDLRFACTHPFTSGPGF